MTYREAIRYLESFINYEKIAEYPYKESLKLARVKEFLDTIGSPQDSLRCIHIAGSKGKGSTCAFIAYILREAGYKTGLYTSPHLSDFRERIRILEPAGNRRLRRQDFEGMIPRKSLIRQVERLKPAIEKYNRGSKYGPLSFFEVYTAIAFRYFREQRVDLAVLETGLGGRLDATNTCNALISVIAPISYEHTQKLGNTLAEIAAEKAGIIKRHQPVVITAPQEKEALEVIRNRCKEVGVKLYQPKIRRLEIRLLGRHQQINANLAVAAIKALAGCGIRIKKHHINRGLLHTRWPARCEVIAKRPLVILDGAQNIASSRILKQAVRENFKYNRLFLVLGISKDKDIRGICSELYDLADEAVLTKADNPRATPPGVLAGYFSGKNIHQTGSVKEAKALAYKLAKKDDLILVTGSLFVAGEFRDGTS